MDEQETVEHVSTLKVSVSDYTKITTKQNASEAHRGAWEQSQSSAQELEPEMEMAWRHLPTLLELLHWEEGWRKKLMCLHPRD